MTNNTSMKRRGFTLMELLVVIGIIAVLAAMLLLGMKHIVGSGKGQSAAVTLSATRGMLDELQAKTRTMKAPQGWAWSNVTNNIVTPPDPATAPKAMLDVDFWKIPFRDLADPMRNPDALDAPGAFGVAENRVGPAMINTQIAMTKLAAMPSNRAALDKMQSTLVPEWRSGECTSLWPDGTMKPTTITYTYGARVMYDGKRYYCLVAHQAAAGASIPPSDTTNWAEDVKATGSAPGVGSPPPLVILDDWDNPVVFVPGTGLRTRMLAGKKALDGSPEQVQIVITGGSVARNGSNLPYVVTAGTPFFASGGPDGDLSTGEDNLYSFSK